MKNRYTANCNSCRQHVAAEAGTLSKVRKAGRLFWIVTCPDCIKGDRPNSDLEWSAGNRKSYGVVFSTGERYIRNRRGRCEDAPCCGCCTI